MTIQRRASYSSHPDGCQNVVESGVAKQTSEDTPDNGVQFIMPAGPRGISSQQGP